MERWCATIGLMIPEGQDKSLAQRVLAATGRAVLLAGPAASGKTGAAVELYKHYDNSARGTCLLIAPNAAGARELRDRLLRREDNSVAIAIAPKVTTFATMAADILAACEQSPGGLSAFARRLMLREIIDELHASGKLAALSAVADTPGLATWLDRAISELKRAAVEPDALAGAIGRSRSKASDLLSVYRSYQERLTAAGRYDLEGRMWLARDLLAGDSGARKSVAAATIIADGFTDFTPTQLDMLRLLWDAGRRVVITLPWADDGRERMWQWTRRTLDNVRAAFGDDLDEIFIPAPPTGKSPGLAPLWRGVFDFDAAPVAPPAGLSLIAAAGRDAEVAAVARRVKRLLVEGAPAGSIAVIVRSAGAYRPAVQRIFAECDIPLAQAPMSLTDVPIIRFALDAAAMGGDFAFRDVSRVIANSYFRPEALGAFDGRTVAAAQALIRDGNVLAGRDAYSSAARRLARRCARTGNGDGRQFIAAAEMLERLFDASGGSLSSLVQALDLWAAAGDHDQAELAARDLRALSALDGALSELDSRQVGRAALKDALSAVACPPGRTESLVDVMDVLDARACRRQHVFLMGLGQGQGQFPRRLSDGSLITEAQRADWRDRGVVLDSRSDLYAREMLLFYMAVSRADTTLTLSYLSSDAGGSFAAPGSFLLSLAAPLGGLEALDRQDILPGRFVPPAGQIASARDAVCAGLAGLFDRRMPDTSGALAWAVEHAPQAVEQAAMGIRAHDRRWQTAPCDAFDGRISDEDLLAALSERFDRRHVFSARQLETFAQCPFSFFARYVLNLEPLAEPQRSLEAVDRGIFCHNVLCDVYRQLRDEGNVVDLARVPQADVIAALEAAIARAADVVNRREPPQPVLWQLQLERMGEQLRRYMLGQCALAGEAESLHFELAFGMEDPGGDEASVADPVEIETPAGPLRLRGRIDRVDMLSAEWSHELLVVDYKTGRLAGDADFDSGRSLQSTLYSAAVEKILDRPCAGGVFHHIGPASAKSEQFFAAVKRSKDALVEDASYDLRREAAVAKVGELAAAIRRGEFDVMPCGPCPSYCPYRRICGYSEARGRFKAADPPQEADS